MRDSIRLDGKVVPAVVDVDVAVVAYVAIVAPAFPFHAPGARPCSHTEYLRTLKPPQVIHLK